MFNQLCNHIDIQLLSNVASIIDNEVTLKTGFSLDRIISQTSPKWKEPPSRSDSGTIYSPNIQIESEKLSAELTAKYPTNIPVIAIIYTDDGAHVMGSFNQPARITIIPNPDTDSIQIAAKTTQPIF